MALDSLLWVSVGVKSKNISREILCEGSDFLIWCLCYKPLFYKEKSLSKSMKYSRGNTSETPTPHLPCMMFFVLELWLECTMDDRTIDLSIMHKIVREMTGTLLVGSLWKQAINLQGNNNDSSQGNKGHPLLPVVINLTHSSIGWKKNASSLTTQESQAGGTSTSQLDMQSSLFTEERIQFRLLY